MVIPARMPFRAGILIIVLLLLTVPALRGHAQPSPDTQPPTLILLASDLSWEDLREDGALADIRQLATMGSVALLNTAVSGEATEAAAYLSVGAGERVAAPGRQGTTVSIDGHPRTVAGIAADVYPTTVPDEETVRALYVRRFGAAPPANAVGLALGLPALERIQPDKSRVSLLGALGEAIRQGGRTVSVFGDWRASLAGMDRNGAVYRGSVTTELTPELLPEVLRESDVIIASASGPDSLRLLTHTAAAILKTGNLNLVVASVSPPVNTAEGTWSRLGWIIAAGPGFPPGTLLTSATTRTHGLVANVDIAPTVLALQQGAPFAGSAGHPLKPVPAKAPLDRLDLLNRQTIAAANATVPVLAGYGILAIGTALAALVCLWFGIGKAPARFGLLTISAILITLIVVGYIAPVNPWHYGLLVLGLAVALAAVATPLGQRLAVSPIGLLFSLLSVLICLDVLAGSRLLGPALLSGFYLTGIRFYGIGNEYTGFLLGAVLTAWGLLSGGRAALLMIGIVATLIIGLPWFGADAGGVLAAVVTFTLAGVMVRSGRLPHLLHIAAAFAGAFLIAALLALLDRLQAADSRTHIGGAIVAGQSRGLGAIWDIVMRKIAMNIGIAGNALTLAVVAGMFPIWLLLTRGRISDRVKTLLEERPVLRCALISLLWGACTSAVFNDSGIAMALILLAPPTTAVIHEMLVD